MVGILSPDMGEGPAETCGNANEVGVREEAVCDKSCGVGGTEVGWGEGGVWVQGVRRGVGGSGGLLLSS